MSDEARRWRRRHWAWNATEMLVAGGVGMLSRFPHHWPLILPCAVVIGIVGAALEEWVIGPDPDEVPPHIRTRWKNGDSAED